MDGSQKEGGNFLIYFRKRGVPKKGGVPAEKERGVLSLLELFLRHILN